jgi:hypothetical protein
MAICGLSLCQTANHEDRYAALLFDCLYFRGTDSVRNAVALQGAGHLHQQRQPFAGIAGLYEQPPIPGPGYMWTPDYWASGPYGYFWVPGTWVEPPTIGLLWTPGYWGWRDGIYVWNAGYWGPHVGFYGGVNYGFGYGGVGYEGGRWENGMFAHNRSVNNLGSVSITHVYEKAVVVEPGAIRVSFNGGSGGTMLPRSCWWRQNSNVYRGMAAPRRARYVTILTTRSHGRGVRSCFRSYGSAAH